MSAPKVGENGDEDSDESSEAVSAEEALDMLPDKEEFESEF
ncbi:hypothetical protein SAMN04488066_104145 [Halorubrum aquaticum]|uniref:Uncharacterized protein n=1 Tax=Halorubrum aquaticum TaxID=387340 RepID=A0A1I3A579_9EURY|nr:hypothetical protein [Halorubrum aquaticum]SFH45036.1 hypothetical protein SAMN04488066_104145 [Halorubrum aquaticum]